MNTAQVEVLLAELVETRKSFDEANRNFLAANETFTRAVKAIGWNRRNSIIQYLLIFVVFSMLIGASVLYRSNQHAACVRSNDLRAAVVQADEDQAANIGIALSLVAGATPEQFDQYMEAYRAQPIPRALQARDC